MFFSRKLTFQLTPLLDLLLIVIFAQYMEVRDTSQQQRTELMRAADAKVAQIEEQTAQQRRALEAEQQRLAQREATRSERERRLQNTNVELEQTLERTLRQQSSAGDLIAELFQVPEELLDQVLQPGSPFQTARSAEEMARLREEFEEMSQLRGRAVIKHLLTFGEIRKRCDIWEIYIDDNSVISFDAGVHSSEFRAEGDDEFETKLFQRYKSLTQPKSLVVIIVSWGDVKRGTVRAVLQGLPSVTDRMRSDSNGRTRFEYAVLGFQPRSKDQPEEPKS